MEPGDNPRHLLLRLGLCGIGLLRIGDLLDLTFVFLGDHQRVLGLAVLEDLVEVRTAFLARFRTYRSGSLCAIDSNSGARVGWPISSAT